MIPLRRPRALLLVLLLALTGCATDPGGDAAQDKLIEMVALTGGMFRMGDLSGDNSQQDELPPHQVTVRPFRISRNEVTQELYLHVTGKNPSFRGGVSNLPVENVSWLEAVSFCNAFSTREGMTPCYSGIAEGAVACDFNANGYRLPTEAEWEYACRAGSDTEYHSGSGTEALGRAAWYAENGEGQTHPVGQREANGFGLYDMHGNVAEWCWDWYSATYYQDAPGIDPQGAAAGAQKVLRGGSFLQFPFALRSASRAYLLPPAQKSRDTGIRLVRSIR
jgi:formylglycine-generating enzyme required for sulfatase activity